MHLGFISFLPVPDLQPALQLGALSRMGKPHTVEHHSSTQDREALPCPAFLHTALVVSLLVVELIVAGVPAPGSSCDHGPGLSQRIVTWACGRRMGTKETKAVLVQQGTDKQLSHVLWGSNLPSQCYKPLPSPQELQ